MKQNNSFVRTFRSKTSAFPVRLQEAKKFLELNSHLSNNIACNKNTVEVIRKWTLYFPRFLLQILFKLVTQGQF